MLWENHNSIQRASRRHRVIDRVSMVCAERRGTMMTQADSLARLAALAAFVAEHWTSSLSLRRCHRVLLREPMARPVAEGTD